MMRYLPAVLCLLALVCAAPSALAQETICDDGIDNDLDTYTDCDDPDCDARPCDGISCTAGDSCFNIFPGFGICFPGAPNDFLCDDGVGCTSDVCDPFLDCVNTPNDFLCDDGALCTADSCDPVLDCQNVPNDAFCGDGINCTADTCDPLHPAADPIGCHYPPDNGLCGDGINCTADICDPFNPGADPDGCLYPPDPGLCNDGVNCTIDICDPLNPGADPDGCLNVPDNVLCDDGAPCTDEVCDPVLDCQYTPVHSRCDDGVGCTDDVCFPFTNCQNIPNDANCSGGFCQGLPTCDPVQDCIAGPIPCTGPGESCDPVRQVCIEVWCDDGADNDGDTLFDCEDPDCEGQTCPDDGIACTRDICRGGVCRHPAVDALCDDGLFCNGSERCQPADPIADPNGCVPGIPWCTDPGERCEELQQRCVETDCRDGVDNNGNGRADCADLDCPPASVEVCDDMFDNDCNGLVDCADPVCGDDFDQDGYTTPPCGGDCDDTDPDINPGRSEDCESPPDDDCDGWVNCTDSDCQFDVDGDGQFALPCGEDCDDRDPLNWFRQEEFCDDRQDNNCNDLVDCEDLFCDGLPCDDGAACSSLDTCDAGTCEGIPDDAQCDDGLFCTGVGVCDPLSAGADADGCVMSGNPCRPWQECDEAGRRCVDLCQPDGFEPDDACDEATLIVPREDEETEDHSVCPGGDVDRWRFLAEEGLTYLFHSEGGTDTRGEVRSDDCGTVLAVSESCAGDANFCLEFTAPATGFYTVAVMGQSATEVGDYTFVHALEDSGECRPDSLEPDDACDEANTLNVSMAEQAVAASICPGQDIDRFRFTAVEGEIYRFSTVGTTDVRGQLETGDCGTTLVDESSCGDDPVNFCIFWRAPADGEYVLRVQGRHGGVTGDYILRYVQSDCPRDGWEPDDDCDTATGLVVDFDTRRQSHTICPGEELDYFEFFAQEGADYEFWTEGATDTAGGVLVENCRGIEVKNTTCQGSDDNFCLRWTAPGTGTWKLAVTGDAEGGPYDLYYRRATEPPPACAPDTAEPDNRCIDGTPITPTETEQLAVRTVCPTGDRDHFSFLAEAGRTYEFWTTGSTDTRGSVRGEGCGNLAANDDCDLPRDLNLCITWTAPDSGAYHVRVAGSNREQTTGGYILHYRMLPAGP